MKVRKGLTLAEILLSLAIIVIAFSAIILVFASCVVLNEASREQTIAIAHANYVMEDIKNTNFGTIKNNGDTQWDFDITALTNKGLNALSNESIDTQVSGSDLLDVVVTVTWQNRRQVTQSVPIETLIAEP